MSKPKVLVARAVFPEAIARLEAHFEVEANPDDALWSKAEFIRRLPEGAQLPILAMTANAFDEERQRCLDAGMDDHVAKPVVAEQLFATLYDWLSGARKTSNRAG